jgi:hypothetical protein
MGTIKEPQHVKLIAGLIAASGEVLDAAIERLTMCYGTIDVRSERVPFTFTGYYADEMGAHLVRQWISFAQLVAPDRLAEIKRETNRLEETFVTGGGRRVNIDPGYLTQANLILASTKDFSHRIALAYGIYGEVTLIYKKGKGFTALPWTYPDYQSAPATAFLLEARRRYQEQLKKYIKDRV